MKVMAKNCINDAAGGDSRNPHLRPRTPYYVVGFDEENYRVINEAGDPVLYQKDLFEIIDPEFPDDWVRIDYKDGAYRVNPQEFSMPGFYEDYFDGLPDAVRKFRRYLLSHGILDSGVEGG